MIFDHDFVKFLKGKQRELSKLEHVEYECIKSDLKDEYDKKIVTLKNRLNK